MNKKEKNINRDKLLLDMPLEERERKLLEMSDQDIDFSDIPPLDDNFFKNAKLLTETPKS